MSIHVHTQQGSNIDLTQTYPPTEWVIFGVNIFEAKGLIFKKIKKQYSLHMQ